MTHCWHFAVLKSGQYYRTLPLKIETVMVCMLDYNTCSTTTRTSTSKGFRRLLNSKFWLAHTKNRCFYSMIRLNLQDSNSAKARYIYVVKIFKNIWLSRLRGHGLVVWFFICIFVSAEIWLKRSPVRSRLAPFLYPTVTYRSLTCSADVSKRAPSIIIHVDLIATPLDGREKENNSRFWSSANTTMQSNQIIVLTQSNRLWLIASQCIHCSVIVTDKEKVRSITTASLAWSNFAGFRWECVLSMP